MATRFTPSCRAWRASRSPLPPAAASNGENPDPGKPKRGVGKLVRRVVARVGRKKTKVEQS